ncbi:MAG: hypothetical protein HY077_01310 [Elusimicrobia bacterium]|nr:hypothetical protein [Elusimicrobiota bacterium]
MKTKILAALLIVWAPLILPAQNEGLLQGAKDQQAKDLRTQKDSSARAELLKSRTKDLAKVLDKVVSELEAKGFSFERVQGDNDWNPVAEIGSKVALQRHKKPPKVILKPKAGARIYAELSWSCGQTPCWEYAVKVEGASAQKSVPGGDLRKDDSLARLAPKLRQAVLALIAKK